MKSIGLMEVFQIRKVRTALTFILFDTSHPGGRSKERYRRLLLTAATGPIANGCGFLAFLITVPLTVRYLGPEQMGLGCPGLDGFPHVLGLGIGPGPYRRH